MATAATKTITKYRARPKKKARRKNRFTLPVAVVLPMAMLGVETISVASRTDVKTAGNWLMGSLTGVRADASEKGWPLFHAKRLKEGLLPLGLGILAHKAAGRLGINRVLAQAGVPWIRI